MRRGWSGSTPATAAGKLSITRYLGTPSKKAQAASNPSSDHVHELLAERRPDEAVPRVGQDDDQRPYRTAATGLRVLYQAQTTEAKSISATSPGALSSIRTVVDERTSSLPTPPTDEPPHRRVRDLASTSRKQLVDAGHLQPIGRQPRVHLVGPLELEDTRRSASQLFRGLHRVSPTRRVN